MGQQQYKDEGKRTEGTGSPHNRNEQKDRIGASFQNKQAVNSASGTGSKNNPGKPT